jgi:hypothetical protein
MMAIKKREPTKPFINQMEKIYESVGVTFPVDDQVKRAIYATVNLIALSASVEPDSIAEFQIKTISAMLGFTYDFPGVGGPAGVVYRHGCSPLTNSKDDNNV